MALVKEKAKGFHVPSGLRPHATTIVADSLRLKQMLFNLLANALKFTSQGAVACRLNTKVCFYISQFGIPASASLKKSRLNSFQPYFQIAVVTTGRHWFRFSADSVWQNCTVAG